MPCPRMPHGGTWQQAKAKDKMGLTESRGASSRKQEKAEPGNAARCDGRCNALRWPMQRAALADAPHCTFRPIGMGLPWPTAAKPHAPLFI